jgi:hypothetical protein
VDVRELRVGDWVRATVAETRAQEASERMSLPIAVLLLGFLVFLGYPALSRVLEDL